MNMLLYVAKGALHVIKLKMLKWGDYLDYLSEVGLIYSWDLKSRRKRQKSKTEGYLTIADEVRMM